MEPRISIITIGVRDMARSICFYRDGLGWPTTATDDAGWAIFATNGTRFALFPYRQLAADIVPAASGELPTTFGGITLAHNTRTKGEVDRLLDQAVQAGGRLLKPAQDAFWGGYSGYFTDPDGYPWEIAWSASWEFNDDGSLVV